MKSVIIANGNFKPTPDQIRELNTADRIIAADGGSVHLYRMGMIPDIIIGDLDSISQEALAFFKAKQVPLAAHPSRKNQTDTELCIDHALTAGSDEIVFLGGTGRRLDHTLANIFLLKPLANKGIQARILDNKNEIHMVVSDLVIHGAPGDLLSVIPVSERVTGLTLEGLEYPLSDKTLAMGTALGVSNVFASTRARITIDTGAVLVVKSGEDSQA